LADAFTRAKIYQSVSKTDKFSCSSVEINDSRNETLIATLEKMEQILKQLTELTNLHSTNQDVAPTSLYHVDKQMPNLPISFHEGISTCPSFSDNDNEFFETMSFLKLRLILA